MQISKSVGVPWLLEFLPSNPATRVRFPVGSGIIISALGLGVCPMSVFRVLSCSVFCLVLSPGVALTLC